MALTNYLIEAFDLPNNIQGVPVNRVQPDGPASQAGLRSLGRTSVDIITAIDGVPVADFDEMIAYLGIHTSPGDTVTLTVYRDGDILELPVTLSERP